MTKAEVVAELRNHCNEMCKLIYKTCSANTDNGLCNASGCPFSQFSDESEQTGSACVFDMLMWAINEYEDKGGNDND